MQLGIDATEEDIKYRYRKLSAKIHPDKLRDVELAREGFEEVRVVNRIEGEACLIMHHVLRIMPN
jgi:DnaJ-class molecular chaperone